MTAAINLLFSTDIGFRIDSIAPFGVTPVDLSREGMISDFETRSDDPGSSPPHPWLLTVRAMQAFFISSPGNLLRWRLRGSVAAGLDVGSLIDEPRLLELAYSRLMAILRESGEPGLLEFVVDHFGPQWWRGEAVTSGAAA